MNAAFYCGLVWIALRGLGRPNSPISSSLLHYLQKSPLSSPNSTWRWWKKIKKWLIENVRLNKLGADNKVQEAATITAAVEKPAESLSMQLNPHRFHLLVMQPIPLAKSFAICSFLPVEILLLPRGGERLKFTGWGKKRRELVLSWGWCCVNRNWLWMMFLWCHTRLLYNLLEVAGFRSHRSQRSSNVPTLLLWRCNDEIRTSVCIESLFCFHLLYLVILWAQWTVSTHDAIIINHKLVVWMPPFTSSRTNSKPRRPFLSHVFPTFLILCPMRTRYWPFTWSFLMMEKTFRGFFLRLLEGKARDSLLDRGRCFAVVDSEWVKWFVRLLMVAMRF